MSLTKKNTLIFAVTLVVIFSPLLVKINKKNTCTNYLDYFLVNFDGDCYYNPDVDSSITEIIQNHTGTVRKYNVTTEDGYILTMFRITRENPVGVVLLQPPISAGAIAWLSDGAESLGIVLWKKGFDVWLSNHRGTASSRRHVNLTDKDPDFWDFSFHEIAVYDFDAQFELISKETNQSKVTYIGYSMSSTEALIYASLKPENSQKYVDSYILMAPVSILKNLSSVFKYVFYLMGPFERFWRKGEFFTLEVVRWVLYPLNFAPHLTNLAGSIFMGWNPAEMDPVLFPYIFAYHGRGISNKIIYHYGQLYFNQTQFLMYDYGKEENLKLYGSDLPPPYPLENIKNPMYIIYGDTDVLTRPEDVRTLCEKFLPKEQVYGVYEIPEHNHIDFIFSKYRKKKAFSIVFDILQNVYKNDDSNILT